MIYSLTGKIIKKTLNAVVICCGGVGYYAQCPASVAGALPGVGNEATIYTVMNVTENDVSLYGFASEEQQACFELLTSVSGVGAKVGLAILSVMEPDRVALAISAGDHKAFKAASGVGPKLAQRIVLELKDKVAKGFAAGIDLENVAGAASDTAAAQGAGVGDQHAAGVQFQRVDAHGRQQAAGTALFPDDGRAAMAALHIEHVGVEGLRLRQHGHVDRMGGLLPCSQGTAAVQQGTSAVEGTPEGALALHLAAG